MTLRELNEKFGYDIEHLGSEWLYIFDEENDRFFEVPYRDTVVEYISSGAMEAELIRLLREGNDNRDVREIHYSGGLMIEKVYRVDCTVLKELV